VYHRNRKQAYDGFFYKAKYENGNPLGKNGIDYMSQGVTIILRDNIDDFRILLGKNSTIRVLIGENPKSKSISLFLDGQNVLNKTL
jgi:hypothetical protein